MAAHYDDPNFSYTQYWQGRDYEHESEVLAIRKLLGTHKFTSAADIGGGFGRLIPLLSQFSRTTYLIEPSLKQRRIAGKSLAKIPGVHIQSGTTQRTHLPDKSLSLITVIRVMHHLPAPLLSFQELFRVLRPGGTLILEFANSKHFKAQIQSVLTGKPILPTPIERRSPGNIRKNTIPFVNHHPITILKNLHRAGFVIDRTLSVSNLRSPFLKRTLPYSTLISLENKLQSPLAKYHFGPSIFILAHKPSSRIDK